MRKPRAGAQRKRWPLTTGDRIAMLGVLVAVVAAVPAYVVFLADSGGSPRITAHTATVDNTSVHQQGQIDGGRNQALVADITRGGDFQNPLHAAPCDVLAYRVKLYNPGPGALHRVRVAASINTITSYSRIIPTIVAYAPDGSVASTAAQLRIVLGKPEIQRYIAGSTLIRDSTGRVSASSRLSGVSDAITATTYGIGIGDLGVGVTEYVEFRTKLSCTS